MEHLRGTCLANRTFHRFLDSNAASSYILVRVALLVDFIGNQHAWKVALQRPEGPEENLG